MASSIPDRLARALLLAVGWPLSAAAQGATPVRVPASVIGRVETPGGRVQLPIPGVTVTLHRVGSDSSGAVDSVKTDANGRYAITYQRTPGDEAVYFAAAVYHGIAYFSIPLQSARASGEEAGITVFDTTSRAVPFHVRGHHVVVSSPRPDGNRDVVEVWELSNDTTLTVVGKDSLAAVWSALLPSGATNVAGGQGDVSGDAIVARGDKVVMLAPFGPGVKQISYTYRLSPSRFPLRVPVREPTSVFEVLVEEPASVVIAGALRATDAATTGGRTFKRFLGQDVPVGETVIIKVPFATEGTRGTVLIALASGIALAMGFSLFRALRRRTRGTSTTGSSTGAIDAIVMEIAQLDARFEAGDSPMDQAAYDARRRELKARVAHLTGAAGEG